MEPPSLRGVERERETDTVGGQALSVLPASVDQVMATIIQRFGAAWIKGRGTSK